MSVRRSSAGRVDSRARPLWAGTSAIAVAALLGAFLLAGASIAATAPHRPAPLPRRVTGVGPARTFGTFVMAGEITHAVNVPGERTGERVTRRWVIRPEACDASTCRRLVLRRGRGAGVPALRTVLHLVGPGAYRGSSAFWVGLRCLGRTDAHGSRVPYTIRLWIRSRVRVSGIFYTTAIAATYVNSHRTDRTRCPLGPTADAAIYRGRFVRPA